MNQLTIFDFVEDEQIADSVILNRIQSAFPGWEVLGYTRDWDWGWCEDYAAIIRRGDEYMWVHAELYKDGRARAGYTWRRDFEPHWFERYEKQGKRWFWRSAEDRDKVFKTAKQNAR
ncbi:hypothetical protein [Geobacillus sp. LEMMY01]|uniref:hypothetical protein n=1 Tax=Geobacillus sp. LEMMY01 TaxID=1954237 RepID=UPI0009AE7A8B|nr:hypothetical protein [Geobacillus sp. LEMMY01]OPX04941.1 hypothetical protein B1A75_01410 [Geobacillus sp. LEMMY01]